MASQIKFGEGLSFDNMEQEVLLHNVTLLFAYTLKNSVLYLRVISMSYCCKSWQLFEPNVRNCFGLIGLT